MTTTTTKIHFRYGWRAPLNPFNTIEGEPSRTCSTPIDEARLRQKRVPLLGPDYSPATIAGRLSFTYLSQTRITVYGGEHQQPFIIHIGLLCHYSPYFANLLKGISQEGKLDSISLPDVQAPLWIAFMDWMFNFTDKITSSTHGIAANPNGPSLTDIYIFTVKFKPQARDLPLCDDIMLAFKNLLATLPLCKILVGVYCRSEYDELDNEQERDAEQNLPIEFFVANSPRHMRMLNLMIPQNVPLDYSLRLIDCYEHIAGKDLIRCECWNLTNNTGNVETTTERCELMVYAGQEDIWFKFRWALAFNDWRWFNDKTRSG
ncbi:hypothetical protein CC78DRAFT_618682 [Lojkania enalia]|uniref:BTB domain-containing protein n=1 Tax=Lojkania enalia TaxID=147567 RepID=A0A9P4K532_9PLEO|nr:hypothetical protein CC78DRAFT_618682 [Didymosphaeria enalia]